MPLPVARTGSKFDRSCRPRLDPSSAGIVLLKNDGFNGSPVPILPLDRSRLRRICVAGPLANSTEHLVRALGRGGPEGARLAPVGLTPAASAWRRRIGPVFT
jgi:hypothetical protein